MNTVWNLDVIYRGFEDPAFAADMQKLECSVQELNALAQQLEAMQPLEGLKKGIEVQEKLSALAEKLAGYSSLRQSANTRDPEAGSQLGRILSIYSGAAAPEAAFCAWASKLPNLMELVRSDEQLQVYEYLFSRIVTDSRYLLPGLGEEIMAKMHLSGGNAWSDLQSYLTSTVPVNYKGEVTNLSFIIYRRDW